MLPARSASFGVARQHGGMLRARSASEGSVEGARRPRWRVLVLRDGTAGCYQPEAPVLVLRDGTAGCYQPEAPARVPSRARVALAGAFWCCATARRDVTSPNRPRGFRQGRAWPSLALRAGIRSLLRDGATVKAQHQNWRFGLVTSRRAVAQHRKAPASESDNRSPKPQRVNLSPASAGFTRWRFGLRLVSSGALPGRWVLPGQPVGSNRRPDGPTSNHSTCLERLP